PPSSPPKPAPAALLGVIAHELAHVRHPVSRTRFLLQVPHGSADADERAAQAVGRRVESATAAARPFAAGIGGDLPVGGAVGRYDSGRAAAENGVGSMTGALDATGGALDTADTALGAAERSLLGGVSGSGFAAQAVDAAGTASTVGGDALAA